MHTNEEYYSFLKDSNIPGGDDLYERVLNVESLYTYGFYENVQHAVRMFFECFIDNICKAKKIDYQYADDIYKTPNYTKTMKYIFLSSDIKDPEWYRTNDIENVYELVNKSSHNKGLEKASATRIMENNETLLYIIRDTCIWYYYKVAKFKRKFDDYCLPDTIKAINSNSKTAVAHNPYEEINKSIQNRNQVLSEKLRESSNTINILQDDNKKLQKYIEKLSKNNETLENQITILRIEKDKITTKLSVQKSIQAQYDNLQKKYKQSEDKKNELAQLLKEAKQQEESVKKLIKENNKLLKEPTETLEPKPTNTKKEIGVRTKRFYNNVFEAIKGMNELGCYVNMNTLFKFFKAIHSPQSDYCPQIRKHPLWGYYLRELKFEYRYLEKAINYLLENDLIILNNNSMYELKQGVYNGK